MLSVFECEFTLVRRAQRTTLSVYLTSCSVLLLAPTDVDTVNSLRLDAGQNQYQHPWLTPALCCIQETLPIACLHYGDSVRDRIGGNKQLHSTRLTWEQASIHPLYVDFAVTLDDAVSSPDMITNVDWTYPQLNKVGCQMFLTSLWEFSFRAKFSWLWTQLQFCYSESNNWGLSSDNVAKGVLTATFGWLQYNGKSGRSLKAGNY